MIDAGAVHKNYRGASLLRERVLRKRDLQRLELRIERERAFEIIMRGRFVARRTRDEAGVIEQLRVACAEPQSFFDRGLRLREFAGLERRPRDRVCAVDVAARFILACGKRVSVVGFQIMIGVEERELAIIKLAVERAEPRDLFDERVLREEEGRKYPPSASGGLGASARRR